MKQSCIMRQCIAVSAQKAQAGLLPGVEPPCPRGALWDEGGLRWFSLQPPLVTLGQPALLSDSCVLTGGL